jgi:Fic family protein
MNIKIKKEIFNKLSKFNHILINDNEWKYLIKEETRNSVMIEGYFVSTEELENILNNIQTKNSDIILNYYRTANFIYNLARQNYFNKFTIFETSLISLIRQINYNLKFPGTFRKGAIKISGAKITPPTYDIDKYIDFYIHFVKNYSYKNIIQFLTLIAKQHVLFESIHPFQDGNGRTGRILLNYLLISNGFPPIVLKGDEENKNKYLFSLEKAESSLIEIFKNKFNEVTLNNAMNIMDVKKLINIIIKELMLSIDRLINNLSINNINNLII